MDDLGGNPYFRKHPSRNFYSASARIRRSDASINLRVLGQAEGMDPQRTSPPEMMVLMRPY